MSTTYLTYSSPLSASPATRSSSARWVGRVLTGLAVLFLAFDAVIKLFPNEAALTGTNALGYQPHHLPIMGVLALGCLVLYVIPRTAVIGAVLWTGYLGGAIATHVRVDNPLFSHTLFPIYIAALIWGGLYLRDARVRAMLGRPR